MRIASGSVNKYAYFVAVDATDLKTRETGLASFTVYRSRNGAAEVAFTTPTIVEIDATNMPGVYALLIDEDTTITTGVDEEEYCIHITHTGMAPVTRTLELFRPKITEGTTFDPSTIATAGAIVDLFFEELTSGHTTAGSYGKLWTDLVIAIDTIDNFLDTEIAAIIAAIGTPSNLGSGATLSANLVDIESQTDDIGVAGAGLTSVSIGAGGINSASFAANSITSVIHDAGLTMGYGTVGSTGNDVTHVNLPGTTYGDDELNDYLLVIRDVSTGEFHSRWIIDWTDIGDLATVATLPFIPEDASDSWWLLPVRRDVTGSGGTDWTADEKTAIRSILGIPPSGTTPTDPTVGILDTIRDAVLIIDDFLDTEINLLITRLGVPADLGSGATISNNIADTYTLVGTRATQSSVDTIDDFLDIEIAAIKTVTDKLDTMLVFDVSVWQFTVNALELAPSGSSITDWTTDERTAIRSILGIPPSGTTPTDPTVGILDTIRDAVLVVDDFLDTEIAAIKTVTDKLDTMLVLDIAVWQFTVNALELGPSGSGIADWTVDERTAIRSILGIPISGTTPTDPTVGILDTIRDTIVTVSGNLGVPLNLGSGTTLANNTADIFSRMGVPTNFGSGATLAGNLIDIEAQTDDIGAPVIIADGGITNLSFMANSITSAALDLSAIVKIGYIISTGNVLGSPAPTTTAFRLHWTVLPIAGLPATGAYNDQLIRFTTGGLADQTRPILTYTKVSTNDADITLEEPLTSAPVADDAFAIHAMHVHPISQIQAGLSTAVAVADVKAKTDLIPASPAAIGSAMTLTAGERIAIVAELFGTLVETGGDTVQEVLKLLWAFMGGLTDVQLDTPVIGTTRILFKNKVGNKDRIMADLSAANERTAVVLDTTD